MMKKEHYGAIDGLRTIACIGIVMMHLAANTGYSITGFFYNSMIPSFTNFVYLFMTVSAFGMCCGYYHKMLNNQINLSDFYTKRFKKILPFFAILVLIDVLLSPSLNGIYEAFADLTLLFGFLPNAGNISVIGVGWFLGLIFVFYICFPFYCVLIKNKKRAWIAFFLSLIFNFVCSVYFGVGRTNVLYSSCYLIAGGLIYLYRTNIRSLNQWILLAAVLFSVVLYYLIGANTLTCLLVSSSLLIYAISNRGGYFKTNLRPLSVPSAWKYIFHTWLFFESSKNLDYSK
ncbi:acyltransferase family protein [Faecalicoccus pleomorphus]|uniref:acyltransferase family protein n=1 Tax=Faecalicoccus pleomorphus TaxID=1323 RepID=UPI0023310A82|nr:acyltransferase [Faecalicoccus pleomorphus]MDB7984032.1 acyltransferase [Faecalicoccus pleomorphus]